jgi:hypothetical protein
VKSTKEKRRSLTVIRIGWLFSLALVLFASATFSAPPKPNFTGTWKVNFRESVLQIPAPESTVFVIEHHEPHFHLTRTHTAQGKSDTFSIDLTTNGKEVVRRDGKRTIYARAHWEGSVLVFDSRIVVEGKEATNVVRYRMAEDGRSFTAKERFRGPQLNYDNVWVLKKQK